MYDELVKRLRSEAVYLPEKFSKNAELLDALIKAADAIEELQQQVEHYHGCMNDWFRAAQEYKAAYMTEHDSRIAEIERHKWIPATALPSENDRYLTVAIEPWFGTTIVDTMRWSGVWMYDGRQTEATVTHWMPLPEPPKEKT